MPSSIYRLAEAHRDLQQAGLLDGCLTERDGRWGLHPVRADDLASGFRGAAIDSRRIGAGELFVALAGERTDGRNYVGRAIAGGAAAVLTRVWSGEPSSDPLLRQLAGIAGEAVILLCDDPPAALGCLATQWRRQQRQVPMAAVTGSNGKTTTKDFLAAAASAAGPVHRTAGNYNNELGLPLTLLGIEPEHRFAVVEMGASAVGDIARLAAIAQPDVGAITNAAEAHLAAFGSLDGVIRGKGELLTALPPAGVAVLNAESPGCDRWREMAACTVVTFGRHAGDHRWSWQPTEDRQAGLLKLDGHSWQVPLPGEHNAANLTCAILVARALGIGDELITAGLSGFSPSPHRSLWCRVGDVRVLDDSYNANPASVRQAATALCHASGTGRSVAVLGLMAELGERSAEIHRRTGESLHQVGLQVLLAVGEGAEPLAEGFKARGGEAAHVRTKADAVAWLVENVSRGDLVLVKGSRVAAMEEVIERWRLQPGVAAQKE